MERIKSSNLEWFGKLFGHGCIWFYQIETKTILGSVGRAGGAGSER